MKTLEQVKLDLLNDIIASKRTFGSGRSRAEYIDQEAARIVAALPKKKPKPKKKKTEK